MGESSAQIVMQRAKECRRRQQPIRILVGGCVRSLAGQRAARVASSLSLVLSRSAAASSAAAFVAAVAGACGGPQKPFCLFVEREFILLEFSVCSCGVSLVSLS